MDPTITATVGAAVAATFVGLVQAAIYLQQSANQARANKQSLFDRRLNIYRTIRRYASSQLASGGIHPGGDDRRALEDLFVESEFIFSEKAAMAIDSLRHALAKFEDARQDPEFDFGGSILKPAPPIPAHLNAKLRGALDRLHDDLSADLDLTSARAKRAKRRARAQPLRPAED